MDLLEPLRPGCTMRLLLMRHGALEERANGRCYGQTDFSLSEKGYEQVRRSVERLRGTQVHALYTSPLVRAQQSARIAADQLGIPVLTVPDLYEINVGAFENLTYEEIERAYPVEYKSWMEHPSTVEFPGGESFLIMKRRVLGFIANLENIHAGQTVLLVAHGGVNRIVLANALGFDDARIFDIPQDYGALSVIDYFSGALSVRMLGQANDGRTCSRE